MIPISEYNEGGVSASFRAILKAMPQLVLRPAIGMSCPGACVSERVVCMCLFNGSCLRLLFLFCFFFFFSKNVQELHKACPKSCLVVGTLFPLQVN